MLEITLKINSIAELNALGPALTAHLAGQTPPANVPVVEPADVVSIADKPKARASKKKAKEDGRVPDSTDPAQPELGEEPTAPEAPAPAPTPAATDDSFIAEITAVVGKQGGLMPKLIELLKEFDAPKARNVKPEARAAFLAKLRALAAEVKS